MTFDLFDNFEAETPTAETLADGATLLRGFARPGADELVADVQAVIAAAPLRHLLTPGGLHMSVAMTNCGTLGWYSDRRGYRYAGTDPQSGLPWPPIPASFRGLAIDAARAAGFEAYVPDACLINRYVAGSKLSLHQDRDEKNLDAPIVSVSLGLPATFVFGGLTRRDEAMRISLRHGDVVVWGGPSRLRYHGVLPLANGEHVSLGKQRINLTFRTAG